MRARLLLSLQRALLGEVSPNIRAVTSSFAPDRIILRWIIDGAISDDLKESLSSVGTEVVADFPDRDISEEYIGCDAPADIGTHVLDLIAYRRKE